MADPDAPRAVDGFIRLASSSRLSLPDAQAASLHLASGEAVRLNRVAAGALRLCDGTRTADEIAAACNGSHEATLEFLSVARALGWIVAHPGSRG